MPILLDSLSGSIGFENLFPGVYELEVTDELGCITRESVQISFPYCPIYVPNIMSQNENLQDEIFRIATHEEYNAIVLNYRIYDRWGSLVHTAQNFDIHNSEGQFWRGRINGKKAEQGVYTYVIDIAHPNEFIEQYSGTLMLLR